MIADKNLNEQEIENNEKMEEKIKKEEKNKKRINDESIQYSRIQNRTNKNNSNLEKKNKISLKEIEFNYIDPFFNQIAKQYDQGGSKGLLLNNIKKDRNLIYILYNQKTNKNVQRNLQIAKTVPFEKISNLTKKFHQNSKEKIISKDLETLKERLLKVGPTFNNLIKKEFTLDINTSMIQIKDVFFNQNNFDDFENNLYEEINCTQIRLSENPILVEEEEYDIGIIDEKENVLISEDNKEDNEQIFFDLEENINEFKSNYIEEESIQENLFVDNFNFWDYLEPSKDKMSNLKRKKED